MDIEKRQKHLVKVREALDKAVAKKAEKTFKNHLYKHGPVPPRRFVVFSDGTSEAYTADQEAYLHSTIQWVKHCDDGVKPPPVPYQRGKEELDMQHIARIREAVAQKLPQEKLNLAQERASASQRLAEQKNKP